MSQFCLMILDTRRGGGGEDAELNGNKHTLNTICSLPSSSQTKLRSVTIAPKYFNFATLSNVLLPTFRLQAPTISPFR
jgi:hypothetical protein